MANDQNGGERRWDWIGHSIQAVGIVAGMLFTTGIPLLIWGSYVNTTLATMATTVAHHDKDIANVQQMQTLVTNQVIDVNKVLIRIDTQLEGIRGEGKATRR